MLDGAVGGFVRCALRTVRVCMVPMRGERGGRWNAMHRQVVRCEWQAVECGPGLRRWSHRAFLKRRASPPAHRRNAAPHIPLTDLQVLNNTSLLNTDHVSSRNYLPQSKRHLHCLEKIDLKSLTPAVTVKMVNYHLGDAKDKQRNYWHCIESYNL